MASMAIGDLASSAKSDSADQATGPYLLRSLLAEVPLSADGDRDDIEITCVEFYELNLYIGTSASEILHFVQIPAESKNVSREPTYILASRLPPAFANPPTPARPGIQQILLLPRVNKACILCNWTVTFYSLPELSPVFGTAQIRPCNWIGGVDLNANPRPGGQDDRSSAATVLVSLNKKMRVVRLGDDARSLKTIDFAGSTMAIRRDSIACVADSRAYALLDVDRQLKIPLFPVSSLDNSQTGAITGQVEDISGTGTSGVSRSTSVAQSLENRVHSRSTSLGNFMNRQGQRTASGDRSGRETPETLFREASPAPSNSPSRSTQRDPSPSASSGAPADKPLPAPPVEEMAPSQAARTVHLNPHIASPTPQEFLLMTGTGPRDPGVGMFVNLEGDVTRSTLDFDVYPEQVVVDGRGLNVDPTSTNTDEQEEGWIIAVMARDIGGELRYGLEIQRWDLNPGEGSTHKYWLESPHGPSELPGKLGIRSVVDAENISFDELVANLQLRRFQPFVGRSSDSFLLSLRSGDSRTAISLEQVSGERELFETNESLPESWQETRDFEERQFAQRLGQSRSRLVAWSKKETWWIVKTPLALQLDAQLSTLLSSEARDDQFHLTLDRRKAIAVINSLRGREARTETEYVSFGYIKQRAGLLIFTSFLDISTEIPTEVDYRAAEEALLEGGLDPRVILALVPFIQNEIVEAKTGIWIHGGVKDTADRIVAYISTMDEIDSKKKLISDHLLRFLKRFLIAWRRKKGFGSVSNEKAVFRSVDAALLVVLLQLDKDSPKGPARSNSIRAELNELVDHGVDCFERAISLLESHNRLYVLSRLYQSRKLAGDVLATWQRILEGEADEGGEFRDGEQRVKDYLIKIRNPALVQQYGVWLAARNPKLGIHVFAEDRSQVKFEPVQIVRMLRDDAPSAVKDYLEYLVFEKNHIEYINELIAYYLNIVTNQLEMSTEARQTLKQTYETYRALRHPKPTYRQFITDNALPEEWWHSRLRLLQLLGGSQGSASEYDVSSILTRITPFSEELVPEVIILHGRQSHHQEALRLLTHGISDYDTAINYCLLGGSSIYHPISGIIARADLPTRDEQARLFHFLLAEFLIIEDISDRVEQTGSLLERFGGWFDVADVLSLIPDTWSVELVSGFLIHALRRIVRERSESMLAKSLSAVENLKVSAEVVEKVQARGPIVEA